MSAIGTPASSVNATWLRALEASADIGRDPTLTLPVLVERMAAASGGVPALIGEATTMTYAELAAAIGVVAAWARREKLAKGDVVAVAMHNGPELVATWLGLTRVGVVSALINTNLTGVALAHCVRVSGARAVIADAENMGSVLAAAAIAGQHLQVHQTPQLIAFSPPGTGEGKAMPGAWREEEVTLTDPALLIFTSGTTGLPKAAYVSHHRVMSWSRWFSALMDVKREDRLYDCLPMYHSVGGVAAVGAMLAGGGSVVIAKRFSATRFWDDIVRHECTLFQYIGELARYLVNTPPCEAETRHRLRLACGNGLSKDVWERFQRRFRVPRILEFYAATEGNFSLTNVEGKPGSIGRIPAWLAPRMRVEIVKVDAVTGEVVRDGDGRCVRCAADEAGEVIARIGASGSERSSRFEGYTTAADTEKKILRDCFEPDDAWLRSGDLMRRDKAGFFYFIDRLGDTFRWKGENVATTEVAQAIAEFPGVREVAVYGVAVPGHEGKAGMAALVVDVAPPPTPISSPQGGGETSFDLAGLRAHVAERLPAYARPLFLRIAPALAATATFKLVKHELAKQGFDPAVVRDPIYFEDTTSGAYVRLDAELYEQMIGGSLRI